MKSLFILDGSGYIFRAYYGLPELKNDEGRSVHAIFGFFRLYFKLLQKNPDYSVIAWDSPVRTLRKEMYEEYKANRVKLPDDFKRQIQMIKQIADELQLPGIQVPTYEADDIIATVAQADFDQPIQRVVVSADKDLKQLIREDISVIDPNKDHEVTYSSFVFNQGFEPEYLLDYLALIGDASDNVPGVAGIGPKTAQKLIEQYQTIENIYEHIDDIKGSTQQKLRDGREAAILSKTLITLMDVPGFDNISVDDFSTKFDYDLFHRILIDKYGFHSLAKHIQAMKKESQKGTQLGLFG